METIKFRTAGLEKETERAICVKMNLVNPKSDKEFVKFQCIPKSVCKLHNDIVEIAEWFADKMIAEQCDFLRVPFVMSTIIFKNANA